MCNKALCAQMLSSKNEVLFQEHGTYIHHKYGDYVTDSKFTKLFYGKLLCYERRANQITQSQLNVFLVLVIGSVHMTGVVVGRRECDWLWVSMTRGEIALVLVSS